MLGLLVAVAGVLVVLVAVMLWTPIDLDLAAQRDPELKLRMRVSWLFGLVSRAIEPGDEPEPPRPPRESPESPPDSEAWSGGSFAKMWRVVRSPGFLAGVARLVRRLVTGIEIRRAELWARAGFDDPADTGRWLGQVLPLVRYLQASGARLSVEVEPDFLEPVFLFDARTAVRIVPARVVGPALMFALSPSTVRALFAARG